MYDTEENQRSLPWYWIGRRRKYHRDLILHWDQCCCKIVSTFSTIRFGAPAEVHCTLQKCRQQQTICIELIVNVLDSILFIVISREQRLGIFSFNFFITWPGLNVSFPDCKTASLSYVDRMNNLVVCDVNRLTLLEPKKSVSSDNLSAACASPSTRRLMPSLMRDIENDEDAQLVPEVVELQVNHVVSRKGYLNFLEENSSGWIKRYVVSNIYAICHSLCDLMQQQQLCLMVIKNRLYCWTVHTSLQALSGHFCPGPRNN